jgi:purine-binding chemotaxis protein CheW
MSVHVHLLVAGEAYAVPVQNVLEVGRTGPVTPVPGARPELLGVLNLRGRILALVDLAQVLGLHATLPPARMMVGESAGRRAAFVIDKCTEIGELPDPTEATDSPLLAGATLAGDELVGFIDLHRVFASLVQPAPGGLPTGQLAGQLMGRLAGQLTGGPT